MPSVKKDRSPGGRFSFYYWSVGDTRLDPRLPDLMVKRVQDIDFRGLAERGIVNYCFDLDNTLVAQRSQEPEREVMEVLAEARRQGWIQRLCIVSNTIWGRGKERRAERLARQLNIPDLFTCDLVTRKPSQIPFRWALQTMDCAPEQAAMVGDQIYSDVVGGNGVGMFTILLNPISADHWTTRLIARRLREFWLLRSYGLERPQ